MSKLITTTKETLHTCTKCGQAGFTASGLRTHLKSKTCKDRSKALTKTDPSQMKEFETARRHASNIMEHARRTSHESILFGHELNRVKNLLGERRGGDRKTQDQSLHVQTLIPWTELVEQQTGIPYASAHRCMQLAAAAKKHIPILTAPDVLKNPFNALPAARQTEVFKVLEKVADGQSMNQLMHSFGAWKDKPRKSPPPPTKESAANRNENANNQTLTAEQHMEQAKEDINVLADMHLGESWKHLDTEDLADLENKLTAYTAAVAAEHKARKGTK